MWEIVTWSKMILDKNKKMLESCIIYARLSIFVFNYAWKRHHLTYSAGYYQHKSWCKISVWLVKYFQKVKKVKTTKKLCIIYALLCMPKTPSSISRWTSPWQSFMSNFSLIPWRFFKQRWKKSKNTYIMPNYAN